MREGYAMPPSITRSPEQLIKAIGRYRRRRQMAKWSGPLLMLAGFVVLLWAGTR